jgi:16S rRNA (guanine527-N7)-methyltransferase
MNTLNTALQENHIELSASQIEQFERYLSLLNHWNRTHNLTAIKDPMEQVFKHIVDSLTIIDDIHGHVLDAGTGAGLPGIPLAIAKPTQNFYLVDSLAKRIQFIRHVITQLQLANVKAAHHRLEDFSDTLFDRIVSRAFSSLSTFIKTTEHLLAPGGRWIAMKGIYPAEELAELPQDFIVENVRELTIVGLQASRHIVTIKRKGETWAKS